MLSVLEVLFPVPDAAGRRCAAARGAVHHPAPATAWRPFAKANPGPRRAAESQRGFSLPEIASVMTIAGALAAPIITAATSSQEALRAEQTRNALDQAKVALISYAAKNNGCLPFAADSEGGLPEAGDTGIGVLNAHGGDLPWADLDLPDTFLDGEGLRVQYYVASVYTDDGSDPNEITCAAGHRGDEWAPWAAYPGSAADPFHVYYTPSGGDRQLYKIIGTLPAGTPPDAADASIAIEVTDALPDNLLGVRRGPVLNANSGGQRDVISARNAFVLVAPGVNVNGELNTAHIRDANHAGKGGPASAWPAGFNIVDDVTFAATREIDEDDNTESGDDTLLVVSFLTYKTELRKYDMNMEPICEDSC